jgi:hypothetical protein
VSQLLQLSRFSINDLFDPFCLLLNSSSYYSPDPTRNRLCSGPSLVIPDVSVSTVSSGCRGDDCAGRRSGDCSRTDPLGGDVATSESYALDVVVAVGGLLFTQVFESGWH